MVTVLQFIGSELIISIDQKICSRVYCTRNIIHYDTWVYIIARFSYIYPCIDLCVYKSSARSQQALELLSKRTFLFELETQSCLQFCNTYIIGRFRDKAYF